jgi:putative flippase GtrA
VGVVSTVAHALVFLALSGVFGVAGANAVALALTAIGNTAANRRFTFGVRGRAELLRHHLRGGLVFLLTLALTNCALLVLHGVAGSPPQAIELAVLVAANLTATVTRYVAMRTWVFAQRRRTTSPQFVITDRRTA